MSTRLLDTFVGANGTALAAHTPNVGGPWTSIDAGWVIQSNKLENVDTGAKSWAPFARRTGSVLLTFEEPIFNTNNFLRVWLKGAADDDNLLYAAIDDQGRPVLGRRVAAGLDMTLTMPPVAFTPTGNTLLLSVSNARIELRLNNQMVVALPRLFATSWVFDRVQLQSATDNPAQFVINQIVATGLGPALS